MDVTLISSYKIYDDWGWKYCAIAIMVTMMMDNNNNNKNENKNIENSMFDYHHDDNTIVLTQREE